jgi:hypothetical protein
MGQFTIKNVPFIHARYGREITCTFGGTEMPSMTPPPHVNQRCTMTPMENKMNEIKTVTHEGKVYEFDQDYLFSNDKFNWNYGALVDLDGGQDKVFCTFDKQWLHIKEVPASENMGTITLAPVELVDGAAYMFDCDDHSNVIGLFIKGGGLFLIHDGAVFNASACTNIRLMTVESK